MSSIFQRVSSRWISKGQKDDDGSADEMSEDYGPSVKGSPEPEDDILKRKREDVVGSPNKKRSVILSNTAGGATVAVAGANAVSSGGAATAVGATATGATNTNSSTGGVGVTGPGGASLQDIDPEIAKPDYRGDGNVDAAVYQLVGASLGQDSEKRSRNSGGQTSGATDGDINDWSGQPWEKYLNTENLTEQGPHGQSDYGFFTPLSAPSNNNGNTSGFSSTSTATGAVTGSGTGGGTAASTGVRKKGRKNQHASSNVDPALAHLDQSSAPNYDLEEAVRQARSIRAEVDSAQVESTFQPTIPQGPIGRSNNMRNNHSKSKLASSGDKRVSWTGDGSETGGTFTQEESQALQNFMDEYQKLQGWSDNELKQRVWASERQKDSFWDEVAAVLPHRTRASVYKHVRRAYHVFEVRGKWTKEEDAVLGELVRRKGAQWKAIGLDMERMPEDCRDRWRNYVKCGDRRRSNKWDLEEEEQLKNVVYQMIQNDPGGDVNWTLVSEKMGGTRSRIQCRYKWNKLSKKAKEGGREMDYFKHSEKVDLINFLRSMPVMREEEVNWNKLATMMANSRSTPTSAEILTAYTNMKVAVPDYKNKMFPQILNEILDNLYRGAAGHLPADEGASNLTSSDAGNDQAVSEALKRDNEGSGMIYS